VRGLPCLVHCILFISHYLDLDLDRSPPSQGCSWCLAAQKAWAGGFLQYRRMLRGWVCLGLRLLLFLLPLRPVLRSLAAANLPEQAMSPTTLYDGPVQVLVGPADSSSPSSSSPSLDLRFRLRLDTSREEASIVFTYRLPLASTSKNKKRPYQFYLQVRPEQLRISRAAANSQYELLLATCPTLIGPATDFLEDLNDATRQCYRHLQWLSEQTTLTVALPSQLLQDKFREYWLAGYSKSIANDYVTKGLYTGHPVVDGVVHNPTESPPLYFKEPKGPSSPELPVYSEGATKRSLSRTPSPAGLKKRKTAGKRALVQEVDVALVSGRDLAAQLKALDDLRRNIEADLEKLNDARQALEADFITQQERTDSLINDVEECECVVADAQSRAADIDEGVEAAEALVSKATDDVNSAKFDFEEDLGLHREVTEALAEELYEQHDSLRTAIEALDGKMDVLRTNFDTLRRRYDAMDRHATRAEQCLRYRKLRSKALRRVGRLGKPIMIRTRAYRVHTGHPARTGAGRSTSVSTSSSDGIVFKRR
jgi:prefoldin subunit 5